MYEEGEWLFKKTTVKIRLQRHSRESAKDWTDPWFYTPLHNVRQTLVIVYTTVTSRWLRSLGWPVWDNKECTTIRGHVCMYAACCKLERNWWSNYWLWKHFSLLGSTTVKSTYCVFMHHSLHSASYQRETPLIVTVQEVDRQVLTHSTKKHVQCTSEMNSSAQNWYRVILQLNYFNPANNQILLTSKHDPRSKNRTFCSIRFQSQDSVMLLTELAHQLLDSKFVTHDSSSA